MLNRNPMIYLEKRYKNQCFSECSSCNSSALNSNSCFLKGVQWRERDPWSNTMEIFNEAKVSITRGLCRKFAMLLSIFDQ